MFGRRWRLAYTVALLGALVLALGATTAIAGEDAELLDVSKTTSEIQKKMDELREKGGSARRGKLAAQAVCGESTSSQVFAQWGDLADYAPVPQGDVEDTSAWDVNDDVSVTDENSPFSGGSHSLLLGDHGEAITPVMCISTAHPTIRFFARNTGSPESTLEIEIFYENLDGKTKKLRIARLRGSDEWRPTLVVPIHVNMLAAASEDGLTAVALRFKARDVKSKERHRGWRLDDVLVDPFKKW